MIQATFPRFLIIAVLIALSSNLLAQERDLGPGDVVRVTVYGQKDLDTVTRVSTDGNITFPLIGSVGLAGLSAREAEQEIATQLTAGNFVRNPQVSVFVEETKSVEGESVTILGQVNRPGRFAVQSVLEGGVETIVGLVAMAGGTSENAAEHLFVTRMENGQSRTRRVDLLGLLANGDVSQNFSLKQGDIVFVPRMDVYYIYGEVRNPGSYRLRRGMTVLQAISAGGGLTPRATERGLSIHRRSEDGDIEQQKARMSDALQADDVLVVDEGLF